MVGGRSDCAGRGNQFQKLETAPDSGETGAFCGVAVPEGALHAGAWD